MKFRQMLTGAPAGPTGAITLTIHDSEPGTISGGTSDADVNRHLQLIAEAAQISIDLSEIEWIPEDLDRGYVLHAVAEALRAFGLSHDIGWASTKSEHGEVLALFESTSMTRRMQEEVVEGGNHLLTLIIDADGRVNLPEQPTISSLSFDAIVDLVPRVQIRFSDSGINLGSKESTKYIFNRAAACFMDAWWFTPKLWVKRLTTDDTHEIEKLLFTAVGRAVRSFLD